MSALIVTGGCGFIGSHLVDRLLAETNDKIIIIDKLSYASNVDYIRALCRANNRVELIEECITNRFYLRYLLNEHSPRGIFHLAAESHVDRSINNPRPFIESNIVGTFELLEAVRAYRDETKKSIRFIHISTDEVYGDLGPDDPKFNENTSYKPSSPYSASKASSDHLVRAWNRTYELDTVITNCSNNYGSRQHQEKLIPCIINKALKGEPLPVYGDGKQIRDWLYVEDHANALVRVFNYGQSGETYCIGGNAEMQNIDVVKTICSIVEQETDLKNRHSLISYVKDRPGHDVRYAIDTTKIKDQLGWYPFFNFKYGIQNTVKWYLNK